MALYSLWRCLPLVLLAGSVWGQGTSVPGFSAMAAGAVAAPWRTTGLPGQKMPLTQFAIVAAEGRPVLRVATNASYGNLVFDSGGRRPGPDTLLRWSWMLERGLQHSDLSTKDGDDVALKVCALFDMPLDGLGMAERTKMRMARSISGEPLPAATLCYVWDRLLPVGSIVANVFSARVRYLVVGTGPAQPGKWMSVERNLAGDFLRAFGQEATAVPPLLALAVGADADNTGGQSLGFVGDVSLAP
jgi:hypothetical protein